MTDEEKLWSMSEHVLKFIRNVLPKGSTILELGSGWSTGELAKDYTMISVEENEKFINLYPSTYIHCPVKNGWYDVDILRKNLPKDYDMLIVDGPVRIPDELAKMVNIKSQGRQGFVKNLDLFNPRVTWIIDDVQHIEVLDMVTDIGRIINKVPYLFPTGDSRIFGVFK
jgi:hypothetical protein